MKRISMLAIAALSLWAAAVAMDIQISSSVRTGDKLSGAVTIRATVIAKATVNQVEFYVNDKLRVTDTSTPYTLLLDTIPEKEGPLALEIAAFTSDGESKRLKMTLIIDNDVAKGAKFHIDNATRFLNDSKWDEAIQAARVALKADENSVAAKLVMARAYLGKDVFDKAQQWAEDAVITEESVDAAELLAGIHVQRAFRIISMSGDKGDALKEIAAAFKAAVAQRLNSLNMQRKTLGPVTDANRLRVAAVLIRKHEYSEVRRILQDKWKELTPDTEIGNLLIYANMRSGRMSEAYKISQAIKKNGTPNATTWALLAAGQAYYRNFDDAAAALREGGFDDQDAPTLMTASAYTATRKGDKAAMSSQIARMLSQDMNVAEVYYYLSLLQFQVGQFSESRDNFRKALFNDPLLYDAYIERGYQALFNANIAREGIEKDKPLLLDQAKAFFEIALAAKPDAAEALNGLALTYLYKNDGANGLKMAQAAAGAGPEYPWAHFTLSAAYAIQRQMDEAQKSVKIAGPLDKTVLEGRAIPTLSEAWTYTARYARLPVIIPPK